MKSKPDFSIKPTIQGHKIVLRPFQSEDIQPMLNILSDYEVRKLTGSICTDQEAYTPASPEEIRKTTQWYHTRNNQSDRLDLAIVEKTSNKIVGEVVFNEYDNNANKINFRILIGPDGRNKGLGSEATALYIKYGFDILKLHKITLEVFSFNPRGEHVYLKNGFVQEGILREDFKYENEYIDSKIYSILSSEYYN
ncbi:Spermidine N(1)-acetyltransferase [compost metagenome]